MKAYGKINLSLDVLGKLDNGYHEVKMIMQSVGIYDELEFEKTDGEISIVSDCMQLELDERNLIYKAIVLLRQECGFQGGVKVKLTKNIPIAAGMAGGSTDAAATLRGVNDLYSLGLSVERLKELGVRLGADVPYCIIGGTALSEGIGEKLTVLKPAPNCVLLVAKPDINVSTKYVYEQFDAVEKVQHPDVDGMVVAIENEDIAGITTRLGNVLESVTVVAYPIIDEIKSRMMEAGAKNALMSGSGPTVFGIFESKEMAQEAMKHIADDELAKQIFITEFVGGNYAGSLSSTNG